MADPEGNVDEYVEIVADDTVWRFETAFLESNWTCLFGQGCKGILTEPAEHLNQGCCSLGAHFGDGEAGQAEARQISAYVSMLTPAQWQYHDVGTTDHEPSVDRMDDDPGDSQLLVSDDAVAIGEAIDRRSPTEEAADTRRPATVGGHDGSSARGPGETRRRDTSSSDGESSVGDSTSPNGTRSLANTGTAAVAGFYGDIERTHTRVVDGACVFLNRPGFEGGEGCALHIAAIEAGDPPTEWKLSVCWQLPLRIDWALVDEADSDGAEIATVRRWSRADWGEHGQTMAWCCTERSDGGEAYCGTDRVIDSLGTELTELAGETVYVELRSRLDRNT